MRQHNNSSKGRMRGRGRKPGNPLNRNYESNGPDVKIRGNAGHIAEKYQNLARDALSNGDTVMAENYFQHAEHYSRIVAAAQQNNPQNQPRSEDSQSMNGRGPQPEIEGVPAEVALGENAEQTVSGDAEKAKAEGRSQRGGRSRSRKTQSAEASDGSADIDASVVKGEEGESQDGSASKPAGRTRRPRARRAETISEDAAGLPDSLTGAPAMDAGSTASIED